MKIRILSLIVLLSVAITTAAQWYDADKVKDKSAQLYAKAIELLRNEELKEAMPFLLNAIEADSNHLDAYLSAAGVFGQLKQYKRSNQFYEKARAKDPVYFGIYNLPYSINLAGEGKFKEALAAVDVFLQLPKLNDKSIKSATYRKRTYEFALAYAAAHQEEAYQFNPINLGDSVNSVFSEYYPSVTVTDSLLVFTRRGEHLREDFFQSTVTNDRFGKAKLINGDINIEPQKGAITVSQDGEWMLFAARFAEQGYGNFDIYISYYTPQGWSEPQNMGTAINTDFWESSPAISPDKRTLYFSSNRPGGFGGRDLYVSYRKANGSWTPAVNMGPTINTAGDELAPFIHADNQTLYFTSDGLPGYGGSDLYVIRKNTKGEWGIPENLGYPINTIENEGSLAVSADGLTAFYASDRADSRGQLDLYRFAMRKDIRPFRTLYVRGIVTDKKTGAKLPSTVALIENSTGESLMKVQTDETGEYFITLPTGKDYTFIVNRKGYLFYSEQYALRNKEADSVYRKNILLQPIELNANYVFNNILFNTNAFDLPAGASIELDKLIQVLNENPQLQIEIGGHTDNIGKPEDNNKLSTERAKSIATYIIKKGIDAQRVLYKGHGSTKPIADNKTEAGRAINRRTTVTITKI